MNSSQNKQLFNLLNKSKPLENFFEKRPFGPSYTISEVTTLSEQFGECQQQAIAKDILDLLKATERFLQETDERTAFLRNKNPNTKTNIETALNNFATQFNQSKSKLDSLPNPNFKSILQSAISYCQEVLKRRQIELDQKKDPCLAYVKPVCESLFKKTISNNP